MKLSVLTALASVLVAADAIQVWKRPTVEDAAVNARTLIQRESLANINTVYQEGDDKGLPASFVEYYTDCGDGNPVILAIDMATSFRNVKGGSPYSLTVRVGDHAPHEQVDPRYPGSRPHSVAGSPRINLRGKFETVKEEEVDELQKCFLKRHKDAAWWLPGNPIHSSHFVKFMVDEAYFLGGFGDTGYIGKIPKELYQNASSIDNGRPEHHEDDKEEFVKQLSEGDGSNWGYDAYMLQHSLKSSIKSTFKKIDGEIKALKELLNEEKEIKEGQTYADEEQLKEFIKASKNKFSKRNEEQVPLTIPEVNLSSEQINKLINELEQLKTDFLQFGQKLIEKTTGDKKVEELKLEEVEESDEEEEFKPRHRNFKHKKAKCNGKGRIGKDHKDVGFKKHHEGKPNHHERRPKHHEGNPEDHERRPNHHERGPKPLLAMIFDFFTGGNPEHLGPRPHHSGPKKPHHFKDDNEDELSKEDSKEFKHFKHHDFKQRRPKNVKFESDFSSEKRSPKNIKLGLENINLD
ncbi:Mitochondrial tumor suppressor 1 [Wickerhamomyces ciferrii]|uniref:Mitochondrial tumor suppressor 1 n=1 Tax=Wickerhamomyces ciferrii (strain ATCC 14091 / BCRC 22168 / CBS 111 / JCM 3599 / NBRC 0793 / NRRL Y-1031 F-60-10) TaxID=1206466 RepID=K0KVA0_WICCF|nr:Mitochondrial tumor suppressor 1 [Wickerhamomyces ciferrii]CCH45088.1 Mitochondrial tumor suppressor 1 [Wickerhamomyces ciferrii]